MKVNVERANNDLLSVYVVSICNQRKKSEKKRTDQVEPSSLPKKGIERNGDLGCFEWATRCYVRYMIGSPTED